MYIRDKEMKRKTYCHVCDKVVESWHGREHFNWEEFATPEEIARSHERYIGYMRRISK
jgi:hypothetical protein